MPPGLLRLPAVQPDWRKVERKYSHAHNLPRIFAPCFCLSTTFLQPSILRGHDSRHVQNGAEPQHAQYLQARRKSLRVLYTQIDLGKAHRHLLSVDIDALILMIEDEIPNLKRFFGQIRVTAHKLGVGSDMQGFVAISEG